MNQEPIGNGTADEPIKRSEFESTMIALAKDLRFIRETMVTMVTKQEAQGFATKEDLRELKEELNHEFKAAVEIITDEMRGAHKDEIATLQGTGERHEQRITVLEQRVGLRG
jgi:hypothetical protein